MIAFFSPVHSRIAAVLWLTSSASTVALLSSARPSTVALVPSSPPSTVALVPSSPPSPSTPQLGLPPYGHNETPPPLERGEPGASLAQNSYGIKIDESNLRAESLTELYLPVLDEHDRVSPDLRQRRPTLRRALRDTAAGVDRSTESGLRRIAGKGGGSDLRVLEVRDDVTGPFQFLETSVLTFRGDLLSGTVLKNRLDSRSVKGVQPSIKDESIFFLMDHEEVWRLHSMNATTPDSAGGTVSLSAGPFSDTRAFTIVDMERYGGRGRFLVLADSSGDTTLRTFSVDSSQPPFMVQNVSTFVSGNAILSVAANPSLAYLYFSTRYAIISSGYGTVVRLVDDFVAFQSVLVSQHAISADGQLMYVADCSANAIYRVRIATGQVETIGIGAAGSVLIDLGCPSGLALTSDGCNLFVSELNTGRIRLISFERSAGHIKSTRTLAGNSSFAYTDVSSLGLFSLAISPDG
ncbi:hypothetical protein CBR_g34780 [Chara braunii]|uniref:SMP-30/Gluconolactonase/LRE-like region domain-containing protein n=1 Tax=Chara braunii TaxID=69332 RepID=A0A388LJA0_CHABU|nr:hypothetical protein CBR_g34780 [Chara braunii]|eukprot:GBG82404.1 hypothetical protein CBR_g34780 [Chara braunii]